VRARVRAQCLSPTFTPLDPHASPAFRYVYEYDLDSTRGRKRILNTVTITGSRLYILNAMYKCEKDDEACNSEAAVASVAKLRGLAASFQLV
jgi:hypothetical protein